MGESKLAPGPWETGTDEDGHIIYDADLGFVADCGRDDGDAEREAAHAAMLSASLDLYAACEVFVQACQAMYRNPGQESMWFDEPFRLAQAALTKAKGEQANG